MWDLVRIEHLYAGTSAGAAGQAPGRRAPRACPRGPPPPWFMDPGLESIAPGNIVTVTMTRLWSKVWELQAAVRGWAWSAELSARGSGHSECDLPGTTSPSLRTSCQPKIDFIVFIHVTLTG